MGIALYLSAAINPLVPGSYAAPKPDQKDVSAYQTVKKLASYMPREKLEWIWKESPYAGDRRKVLRSMPAP